MILLFKHRKRVGQPDSDWDIERYTTRRVVKEDQVRQENLHDISSKPEVGLKNHIRKVTVWADLDHIYTWE